MDVVHGTNTVLENLPLTAWAFKGDLGADIKTSGTATCVYIPPDGEPFAPKGADGILSPYRARLILKMKVTAGAFSETVLLGWGRVMKTPGARDTIDPVLRANRVTSSVVPIVWDGLERNIQRSGFYFPTPAGTGAWDELARITGLPVTRNVPDTAIPKNTVWEAKQGGRLDAVQQIASLLGGRAAINPAGQLTILPNALPRDPILILKTGPDGTITDLESDIDIDNVYNEVVGLYEVGEDRRPVYSIARVDAGPLSVSGDFGLSTRYHASDLVTDQESADKAARSVLEESIGSQTYKVQVQCITHPLVENNDYVEVQGVDRTVRGRVIAYELSDSALMTLVLEVRMVLA
ncbi:hypothetical protein M2390_002921 [Mycetocola sp. BIGb0189]|uniref:hypothetical protein n=1 Tax=Mycetocola sp. BIGb0189 TaxID=2940604 RepID=UPI002167DD7D|nr:hypothetical protein [Mycetocola sp. BIGb0189]MCS4277712.1 hypothetical protein [Mycetocola sp. BIGb0189]